MWRKTQIRGQNTFFAKFGVRALFEGRNCKKFRVRCGHKTATNVASDRSSVASAHLLKKCSDPESAGKCALRRTGFSGHPK